MWTASISAVVDARGTLTLLKEAPEPPQKGDILDLGAGYGPIAITLARKAPEARVWAAWLTARANPNSGSRTAGPTDSAITAASTLRDAVRRAPSRAACGVPILDRACDLGVVRGIPGTAF